MTDDSPAVEIRVHALKPTTRNDHHRIVVQEALALPQRRGVRVLGCGPCSASESAYVLIRAFSTRPAPGPGPRRRSSWPDSLRATAA